MVRNIHTKVSAGTANSRTTEHVSALVVGLGSSAGGLDALTKALGGVSPDLPISYIVAQHVSPDFQSQLVELLARATELDVRVCADGDQLTTGVVTVCPPHMNVTVVGDRLRLTDPSDTPSPHPNIDMFFESLAAQWNTGGVAVLLSGTGDDGAAGIQAVRSAGGVTVVQDPASAEFDGMPRAALATGSVDAVIAPEALGDLLVRVVADAAKPSASDGADVVDLDPLPRPKGVDVAHGPEVERIVAELRRATGIGFSEYKSATLLRQIARRQAMIGCADLSAYCDRLISDHAEAISLCSALLVSVTSFFRDAASWSALSLELNAVCSAESHSDEFRVWVPGCSTGEEAYTAAMVAAEALGNPVDLSSKLKVFATDLSDGALNVARRGRYSDSKMEAVSEGFKARWWHRTPTGWDVSPALRDAIVFAKHNVATDPPFPRIDLVSLRNTMIYFQAPLQQRVLRLCQYSLVPGGLLFLGNAERIGGHGSAFTVVDSTHRIYRCAGGGAQERPPALAPRLRPVLASSHSVPRESLRDSLIEDFVPPTLVIDKGDDVIDIVGDVSQWCWVASGPPSAEVTALVREELRTPVRVLLLQLRNGSTQSIETRVNAASGPVRITARFVAKAAEGTAAITFVSDVADSGKSSEPVVTEADRDVALINRELEATQAALQTTVEDLSASNEELRALNEELQAASEESQSSNEELEAANEELSTLNQELQVRTASLGAANADLENIQASVSSGLVLVDRSLRITRFTQPAVHLFALIDDDIGRELTSIPTTIDIPGLSSVLRASITNKRAEMIDVVGEDNVFLLQSQPYVVSDGSVLGAVVTITDITDRTHAERAVSRTLHQLTAITDSLREMVWQRGTDGVMTFLSRGVEQLYGLNRDRVLADPALLVKAVHPDDRVRFEQAMATAVGSWSMRYRIIRADGDLRWIEESAILVEADGDQPSFTVGSLLDVTDRVEIEDLATQRNEILEALFSIRYLGILLLDSDQKIVRANRAFAQLSGYGEAALIGMPIEAVDELLSASDDHSPDFGWLTAEDVQHRRLVAKDGTHRWVAMEKQELPGMPIRGSTAHVGPSTLVVVNDLTPVLDVTGELASQVRFDQQTGALARAHFRERVRELFVRSDRTGEQFAVFWIDLDGFKTVNDTYGHRAGDAVLVEVAKRLHGATRGQDPIGRLGGDEFGILVSNVDSTDGLEQVCERVVAALREPIQALDGTLFVTASVGVAVAPSDATDADVLMHNADTAMYECKARGGNGHTYFQSVMNDVAHERATLRQALAAAVRAQDFLVYYQPIVDLGTGSLASVEALLRWRTDSGVICAAEFIEVAQDTGQLRAIGQIGRDIVERDLLAFDECAELAGVPISVNLSPVELEEEDLMTRLLRWDPPGGMQRIIIEITEQALLPDSIEAMAAIKLLQRLGCRISVDDFGTGYSNLALLDHLRPSFIKLDRTLLVAAQSNKRNRSILHASIEMAHALQATVVIEGIEEQGQANLVSALEAEMGQGYYYARPMPLDELVTWARSREVAAEDSAC